MQHLLPTAGVLYKVDPLDQIEALIYFYISAQAVFEESAYGQLMYHFNYIAADKS